VALYDFNDAQRNKIITSWDPEGEIVQMTKMTNVKMIRGMNSGAIPATINNLIDNLVNNRNNNIIDYNPGSIIFRIL
jgi:hypothetical protein